MATSAADFRANLEAAQVKLKSGAGTPEHAQGNGSSSGSRGDPRSRR
jgi:hypothetical protein